MSEALKFTNIFWSRDYKTGIDVLFEKLFQGCHENEEVLHMIKNRIDLEKALGNGLDRLPSKNRPKSSGFDRDEGATLRQAYINILEEQRIEGQAHLSIATKLEEAVKVPFEIWCNGHSDRVDAAYAALVSKVNAYRAKEAVVKKSQQAYFSRCRQLEDTDLSIEQNEPWSTVISSIHKRASSLGGHVAPTVQKGMSNNDDIIIDGLLFTRETTAKLLREMLRDIPRGEFKLPIIGVYDNVSRGDDIVLWLRKHLDLKNVGKAERFGQGLVDHGFLRCVGRVGNRFMNSANHNYQWGDKAMNFDPDALFPVEDLTDTTSGSVGEYISGFLKPSNHMSLTTKEMSKIHQDIAQADERYRSEIVAFDEERCLMEETIVQELTFMQRCETDRLKAIKTVLGDFAHTLSRPMVNISTSFGNMNRHQASINLLSDMNYLMENYKTSTFLPQVTVYESFHSSAKLQTFGVDLASSSFFIPAIIQFLDQQTDKVSLDSWLRDIPLSDIHDTRTKLNTGFPFDAQKYLEGIPSDIIISTLKEYLLELPDSIVSFAMYDIFKQVFIQDGDHTEQLISTLSHLPKDNVTAIDCLIRHFATLCSSSGNIQRLASGLSRFILRPKEITSLSMADKHPTMLLQTLLSKSSEIFAGIHSRQLHARSTRDRSVSTSESNRKANVEARNRQIVERSVSARAARSRTGSPTPTGDLLKPNSPAVISSSGLLPLTLSPSREATPLQSKSRHSPSQSLSAPILLHRNRHSKSNSTPNVLAKPGPESIAPTDESPIQISRPSTENSKNDDDNDPQVKDNSGDSNLEDDRIESDVSFQSIPEIVLVNET